MDISKDQLLKQTIEKFKHILVNDLKIDDEQMNSNKGLYEKFQDINKYKGLIQLLDRNNVSGYVTNLLINYFNLKELGQEKKLKLEEYVQILIELFDWLGKVLYLIFFLFFLNFFKDIKTPLTILKLFLQMQKLQFFQNKVKKITIEQIRNKEKEAMQELEKKNGIKNDNLQEANDYLSNKFMNFFTARKISYLKYYKKKGEEKNEKNFLSSIKNQLISVYQKDGKVVFSFMTFKEISDKILLQMINDNINNNQQ